MCTGSIKGLSQSSNTQNHRSYENLARSLDFTNVLPPCENAPATLIIMLGTLICFLDNVMSPVFSSKRNKADAFIHKKLDKREKQEQSYVFLPSHHIWDKGQPHPQHKRGGPVQLHKHHIWLSLHTTSWYVKFYFYQKLPSFFPFSISLTFVIKCV